MVAKRKRLKRTRSAYKKAKPKARKARRFVAAFMAHYGETWKK